MHSGHAILHHSMIDWNDLRIVLAVAEHASLSRAARALGVHQTTCGRRLDRLEQGLGLQLFLRSRGGLRPTTAAQQILSTVRDLSARLALLERSLGDEPDRTVRIAVTEVGARQMVQRALPRLLARYPELTIDLAPSNTVADLARGEADLAVRLVRPDDTELIKRRLGWVRYALYGSAAYLARRAPEQPGLAGDTVILQTRELARGPEATWMREHGQMAHVRLLASSMHLVAEAVETGLGLAVLPTNLACLHPGLREVRRLDEIPGREVWLALHRSLRQVPRIRLVADAVAEAIGGVLRDSG